MKPALIAAVLFGLGTTTAPAQEHAGHVLGAAIGLPAICLREAGDMQMPAAHSSMAMPSEAHDELMAGMDRMNADMMSGGLAEDIDVAFVCSMIPHHRGAIDMARAELAHGDDPWARSLAEAIIAAQENEIADMLDWLARQE
jgi:uncharacterized protein (DUF305 family)